MGQGTAVTSAQLEWRGSPEHNSLASHSPQVPRNWIDPSTNYRYCFSKIVYSQDVAKQSTSLPVCMEVASLQTSHKEARKVHGERNP